MMLEDLFVSVNGCMTRYRDTGGDGPVLLLIHGIGSSLETWQAQTKALSRHMRVICIDLPGHGLSGLGEQPFSIEKFAQFTWRFLDRLNIDKVFLAGNSMGGSISIFMMSFQPERVIKIALLNAATLGIETPLAFRLMLLPILGCFITKPGKMAITNQIRSIFYDQSNVTDDIKATIARNVMREGAQEVFVATLKQMTTLSGQRKHLYNKALDVLSSTDTPILFLHGRQDSVLPFVHSQRAQAMTLYSTLVALEDCGHTPQIEKPNEVNKLLSEFIMDNVLF